MNSLCQVDLIDMQAQYDENYRFTLVYQDHLTKYVLSTYHQYTNVQTTFPI